MAAKNFIVGTCGFSFADWVGPFYPTGTASREMFGFYVQHFSAVEINFTFYAMPRETTIANLADATPEGFLFWVKANHDVTHKGELAGCEQFRQALQPMRQAGKLAGLLLQFPQSFHRTIETRKYLAAALGALGPDPLAVEFRHHSWQHPSVLESLSARNVTLAVPDVPDLPGLYHVDPTATTATGYLRPHSRDASKWYAADRDRYDYSYSPAQLEELAGQWSSLDRPVDRVFAFFNNCHRGQAAANAQAFKRIVEQMT